MQHNKLMKFGVFCGVIIMFCVLSSFNFINNSSSSSLTNLPHFISYKFLSLFPEKFKDDKIYLANNIKQSSYNPDLIKTNIKQNIFINTNTSIRLFLFIYNCGNCFIILFLFSIIFIFILYILLMVIKGVIRDKNYDYNSLNIFIQNIINKKNIILVFILLSFIFIGIFHILVFNFTFYFFTTSYVFIILLFLVIVFFLEIIYYIIPFNKQTFNNLRLLFASLCFSLLLSEFIIHISGKYYTVCENRNKFIYSSIFKSQDKTWYHVSTPNAVIRIKNFEYDYPRTTNSLGLSDKEPDLNKFPGEYRIIGLGDSFTEGDGTPEDSTWLKELERNITNIKSDKKFTFINAGVRGSDPYYEYVLLKNKLLKYKPDLVIVAINSSDIDDIIIRGGLNRFKKDGNVIFENSPSWLWFYESSHISRLIVHSIFKYNYLLIKPENKIYESPKSIKLIYDCIIMFNKLAVENNFKLLVVFHPCKSEIINGYYDYFETLIWKLKSENQSINVLDMLDYFTEQEKINKYNYQKYYWKIDGHHNSNGYSAFGRGVEYKLKQMGIVDTLLKNNN